MPWSLLFGAWLVFRRTESVAPLPTWRRLPVYLGMIVAVVSTALDMLWNASWLYFWRQSTRDGSGTRALAALWTVSRLVLCGGHRLGLVREGEGPSPDSRLGDIDVCRVSTPLHASDGVDPVQTCQRSTFYTKKFCCICDAENNSAVLNHLEGSKTAELSGRNSTSLLSMDACAFHLIRENAIAEFGILRRNFRPDTMLECVVPQSTRRKSWQNFQVALGVAELPELVQNTRLATCGLQYSCEKR
jgi:hypothetical protein